MRRLLLALAVGAIIVVTASLPASASSYVQIRINPSTGTWSDVTSPFFIDLPWNFKTVMFGVTGFLQLPNSPFGLRLNLDTGSLTDFTTPSGFTTYDGGHWRYYDIAAGYHFMLGRGSGVLFAGYGNHRAEFNSGGAGVTRQDAGGFIYGLDLFYPLNQSWYLSGSAAYGGSLGYKYLNAPFTTNRAEGKANSGVYMAAIGFRLPNQMTSLEVGWRSGGFRVTSITAGDIVVDGQDVQWSGWFVGLKVVK